MIEEAEEGRPSEVVAEAEVEVAVVAGEKWAPEAPASNSNAEGYILQRRSPAAELVTLE